MIGMILNIQKFCLHDGPGIRTTVFFKGCNLRCKWCANPESQKSTRQLTLDKNKCTGCGACVVACPQNARTMEEGFPKVNTALCNRCGACLEACPSGAIAMEGKVADVEQVLDDVIFIDKGRIVLQSSVDDIREERGMSVDQYFREVFRISRYWARVMVSFSANQVLAASYIRL